MEWLLLSILVAFLLSLVQFIDKYLIENYLKNGAIGSLVIFSALAGFPVAVLILLLQDGLFSISFCHIVITIVNGVIHTLWLIPYFYALEKDDASVVAPLLLLSSIFSLLLGYFFLGESLSNSQILGSFFLLIGAVGLTIEISSSKKIGIKMYVFLLMALASFFVALNLTLFKWIAIETDYWTTSFWEYIGFCISALLLLLFFKSYRNQFIEVVKTNKKAILSLNFANESLYLLAKLVFNWTTLLVPLALVSFVVDGFNPFFLLILGIIFTILFPNFIREKIDKKYIFQKVISIAFLFLGILILNLF